MDIYLTKSGKISQKDNTIQFVPKNGDCEFFPVENTEAIFVLTHLDLNSQFIRFAAKKGIRIFFLSYYGNPVASIEPLTGKGAPLRLLQYKAYEDKKDIIASRVIYSQSRNMKMFLRHYARSKKINFGDIPIFPPKRGCEGSNWRKFYRTISLVLPEEFKIGERTYNPPEDNINALISFVSALLYGNVLKELSKTALDPSISFLHSTEEGRLSLIYDIADIFKPYFVYSVIAKLLNKKILTNKDFSDNMLKKKSCKQVIKKYDEFIKSPVFHKELNMYVSKRHLIKLDIHLLIRYIKGKIKEDELKFFVKWW